MALEVSDVPRRRMTEAERIEFEASLAPDPATVLEPEPWLVARFAEMVEPTPVGGSVKAFVRTEDGSLECWIGRVSAVRWIVGDPSETLGDSAHWVEILIAGTERKLTLARPALVSCSALPEHNYEQYARCAERQRAGFPAAVVRAPRTPNVRRSVATSTRIQSRGGDR
jgi:hypothetical protein